MSFTRDVSWREFIVALFIFAFLGVFYHKERDKEVKQPISFPLLRNNFMGLFTGVYVC